MRFIGLENLEGNDRIVTAAGKGDATKERRYFIFVTFAAAG